jgi:CubicO group peptidase (beta-lactamase class C family)
MKCWLWQNIPLVSTPELKWNYHISTNMLGYMVEIISGKPLREYVKETILQPLGINNTDWYYGPEALTRFVKPYVAADGVLTPGTTMYAEGAVSGEQTYAKVRLAEWSHRRLCEILPNASEQRRVQRSPDFETRNCDTYDHYQSFA